MTRLIRTSKRVYIVQYYASKGMMVQELYISFLTFKIHLMVVALPYFSTCKCRFSDSNLCTSIIPFTFQRVPAFTCRGWIRKRKVELFVEASATIGLTAFTRHGWKLGRTFGLLVEGSSHIGSVEGSSAIGLLVEGSSPISFIAFT